MNDRAIAYLAFAGFCLLSSVRDVFSEVLFKHRIYETSPIFVLFVYSVVTQIVAGALVFARRAPILARLSSFHSIRYQLLALNFFTLTAFLFYFLAINSPLGAAVNAFVDYGSSPVLTAMVGAYFTGTRLNRKFAWAAVACLLGLAILGAPRLAAEQVSWLWILGLSLALLSSLSSAIYRVYFKVLLQRGLSKAEIVFTRLCGVTLVLGGILLVRSDLFRVDLLLQTSLLGLLGFTLPLFLILNIIQRVEISSFAVLLFLYPAITFMMSAALGYTQFHASDLVAAAIIVMGVGRYETTMTKR